MRELLVNLGFDLGLRARVLHPETADRRARVREGAFAWLVGPPPEDSVRLEAPPPEGFLDTVASVGLPTASVTVAPRIRVEAIPSPYGWDRAARSLARAYARPPDPPAFDVVRLVNGRGFADRLSRDRLGDDPGPGLATSLRGVEQLLAADTSWPSGFIVKTEHGNAGLGNRRVSGTVLGERDRMWLERALTEHDLVVVERWRPRLVDLCVTFEVGLDGAAESVAVHETIHTAAGAFIGAVFEGSGPMADRWADRAASVCEPVAAELKAAGYHGPVCADAFVWWDGRRPHLRRLSDLNARRHASWPARQLWQRWAPDRVLYWRWFARRHLRLPDNPSRVPEALGEHALDSERREGVVVVSPTAFGDGDARRPARRVAVAFVARDRRRVFEMEASFRERLAR